ncbi:hypothetical protein [Achromobacter aloeverae]
MSSPDSDRLPLPRLLALTAAVMALLLSLALMAIQLSFGAYAEQLRHLYMDRGYLLTMALDWSANVTLTALIVYACARAHEENHGALPLAARRRVQGLTAIAVVVVTLALQMVWITLYPVTVAPLMQWTFTHGHHYAAPLIMQGINLVQTIIAALLVSLAALAYARRLTAMLGHDEPVGPMVPAARSAAAVFGWTWAVLQLQLTRPLYSLFGTDVMREHPKAALALVILPLLPALVAFVAAAKPLADLQPWRAAPGRAILAALCAFVSAQLVHAAVALGLAYTLGLALLSQIGMVSGAVVLLLIYLVALVPLSRLFLRLFYRSEASAGAPASLSNARVD